MNFDDHIPGARHDEPESDAGHSQLTWDIQCQLQAANIPEHIIEQVIELIEQVIELIVRGESERNAEDIRLIFGRQL